MYLGNNDNRHVFRSDNYQSQMSCIRHQGADMASLVVFTFKVKSVIYQKSQVFGTYPQADLSTKTTESINCL